MPSWSIHCAVAKKVMDYIEVDKNTFLFGNIVADVDDYVNDYGSYATHFYGTLNCEACPNEELPDINKFYNLYKHFHNPYLHHKHLQDKHRYGKN